MKQALSTAGNWHSNCGVGGKTHQSLCGVSLLFSKRVLVAFDTGRGLVFARVSGWNRVYLLWTFRNFRSLPQKVLNPRQQELITTLYRAASLRPARQWDEALIGTVEGTFQPRPTPVRVTANELVPDVSTSPQSRNVGFHGTLTVPF